MNSISNNSIVSVTDDHEFDEDEDDLLDDNNVSMSSLSKIGESDAVASLESLSAFNESDYDILPNNNVYRFVPRVVYKDKNCNNQETDTNPENVTSTNDDICTISKFITESFGS